MIILNKTVEASTRRNERSECFPRRPHTPIRFLKKAEQKLQHKIVLRTILGKYHLQRVGKYMLKPKAIFLDADGTIVDHKECERQALVHLFEGIGVAYKNEYQELFRSIENELWQNESYGGVHVPREDIFVYRFKVLFEKINISYNDYVGANDLFKIGLAASVALMENAVEVVEYLHKNEYMLCVVTNGLIKLQKPRVANTALGKFISHIIVSEEVGAHKPNPLIFNTLLEKLGLSPSDVIMVGDSLKNDILGAKNAGIRSVWYNSERCKNETDIVPDYEISDLLQLKDMF